MTIYIAFSVLPNVFAISVGDCSLDFRFAVDIFCPCRLPKYPCPISIERPIGFIVILAQSEFPFFNYAMQCIFQKVQYSLLLADLHALSSKIFFLVSVNSCESILTVTFRVISFQLIIYHPSIDNTTVIGKPICLHILTYSSWFGL